MAGRNVAILLTPAGVAAIAVIRIAGPLVREFLADHFSKPTPDGRCVHGELRDESGVEIDDPVVVASRNGNVVDLNVHGGVWVVQAVLNAAEKAGFEIGDAREVAEITYDSETPLEREILVSLPLAGTELALRTLLAQPEAWRKALAGHPRDGLVEILEDRSLIHLLHPPRVAIVGAPNVGKSTLANQLFAQERSITADVPGTTRDWVGEIANIDGLAVMLVDTPGVRETRDDIEREAISRSRKEIERADLVVRVLDATLSPSPGSPGEGRGEGLSAGYVEHPHPNPLPEYREREHTVGTLTVVNKADRPAQWDWSAVADIQTVATTGQGVDELRRAIQSHFGCLDVPPNRPRIWTQRQGAIIARAIHDSDALREL